MRLLGTGLQKFYPRFKARGVTEENFVDLQLEDYTELGVVDPNDRHKLFRLKQIIKTELDVGPKSQAAAQARRLASGFGNLVAGMSNPPAQSQPAAAVPVRGAMMPDVSPSGYAEPSYPGGERVGGRAPRDRHSGQRMQQQQSAPSLLDQPAAPPQYLAHQHSEPDLYMEEDGASPAVPRARPQVRGVLNLWPAWLQRKCGTYI